MLGHQLHASPILMRTAQHHEHTSRSTGCVSALNPRPTLSNMGVICKWKEDLGAGSLVWGSFKQAGHVLHLVKVVPFNLLISVPALSSFAICSDEM